MNKLKPRTLSLIAGVSYLGIFFLAIYANFFVLDAIKADPVGTVATSQQHIRFGAMAFLLAAVLDVVVAWVLFQLYPKNPLSSLSTYFRLIHAGLMGAAVFALIPILEMTEANQILAQVDIFNNLWLIGLFFFGFHLILLTNILKKIKVLPLILAVAGVMYIVDTTAHFTFSNYDTYADLFLMMVAIPSILGEMSFTLWLLFKGGKSK